MWNGKKVKILVNNYNYAEFLEHAVQSCFEQRPIVDEIWVCDDGSSDESQKILNNLNSKNTDLHVILKKNGGQCSVFNEFCRQVNKEDYIFLLDSDDFYYVGYVQAALELFDRTGAEVMYSQVFNMHSSAELGDLRCEKSGVQSHSLVNCANLVYEVRRKRGDMLWIGRETSAVSMRGSSYNRLFPFPFSQDFITRADDIIAFGSILCGLKIEFVDGLRVARRIHGDNAFYGIKLSHHQNQMHKDAREKMAKFFAKKNCLRQLVSLRSLMMQRSAIPAWVEQEFKVPKTSQIFKQAIGTRLVAFLRRVQSYIER